MLTFIWILSNRHSIIILVLGHSCLRRFAEQSENKKEWTSDLKPLFCYFFSSWYKEIFFTMFVGWQSPQSVMFCSYHPTEKGHILNNAYNPHVQMFCRHPTSLSQEPSAEYTYWMKHLSLTRLKILKNHCNNWTKCPMNKWGKEIVTRGSHFSI